MKTHHTEKTGDVVGEWLRVERLNNIALFHRQVRGQKENCHLTQFLRRPKISVWSRETSKVTQGMDIATRIHTQSAFLGKEVLELWRILKNKIKLDFPHISLGLLISSPVHFPLVLSTTDISFISWNESAGQRVHNCATERLQSKARLADNWSEYLNTFWKPCGEFCV